MSNIKCYLCNDKGMLYSGCCHCGIEMDKHSVWENHSAVEMEKPCSCKENKMIVAGHWEDCSKNDILDEFHYYNTDRNDINIIFAYYMTGDYVGDAFVLFKQDGELFTIEASHCSCFGLEGQWDPTKTTVEALRLMYKKGASRYGTEDFQGKIMDVIYSLDN